VVSRQPPTSHPTGRLRGLDGLRGGAAVAVMLYHYLEHGPKLHPELGAFWAPAGYGEEGVRLFFVISGFVITMSLRRSTLRDFVVARLIRLFPTYWVCLAVTLVVVTIRGLPGQRLSGTDIAANLTMLQPFAQITSIDGSYWTLAAELAFYAQCALLWRLGGLDDERLALTLYLWLGVAVAVGEWTPVAWHGVHLAVDNLPWFLLGIAALALYEGRREVGVLAFPVVALAAGSLTGIRPAVAAAISFALVVAATQVGIGVLDHPVLVLLGRISYPLYLLHQEVGYVVMAPLVRAGRSLGVAAAVAVLVALAGAAAVTLLFDEPVRRALRHRLAHPRASVVAPR